MNWASIRPATLIAGTAMVAVLAATLVASVTPASAASASGPVFGPFGLTPSPAASGQPRSYFDLSIAPGASISDSVIVTNLSARSERLRLTVSRGVTAANSGSAFENLTGRCTGVTCWIAGLPHDVVLGPKEQLLVGFAVKVPRRVSRGQYLAGITVLAARKPKPVRVGSRGPASAKAIIIDEVTVGVAVTIGAVSRLASGLRIGPVSAQWLGRVPRLNIPVKNTGRTFLHATGRISCLSAGRAHTYRVLMETVLPAGTAVLPVNARGLSAGSLPCRVRLRTESGHLSEWSGAVSLASLTVTRIYHPARGVYTALPEPTIPVWAIVLIALGWLILLALALLLVQRHRQKRPMRSARRALPDIARTRPRAVAAWAPCCRYSDLAGP